MRNLPRLLAAVSLTLILTSCSPPDEPKDQPATQPDTADTGTAQPSDSPTENAPPTEGPTDPPTEVITLLEPMRNAMQKLNSLQVTTTLGGKKPTLTKVQLGRNQNCAIEVSGPGAGGGEASIRVVDGKGYVRGDEQFWSLEAHDETEGKRIVSLLKGRWVRVEPEALGSYTASCSMVSLLAPLEQDPFSTGDLQVGLVADFKNLPEGVGVTVFENKAQTVKLAVGLQAPHYLMALDRGELGRMDFSKFNEDFSIETPKRTVPLSLLRPKS